MRLGARMAKASSYIERVGVGLAEHVADVHERFPVGVREAQERKRLVHADVETRVRARAHLRVRLAAPEGGVHAVLRVQRASRSAESSPRSTSADRERSRSTLSGIDRTARAIDMSDAGSQYAVVTRVFDRAAHVAGHFVRHRQRPSRARRYRRRSRRSSGRAAPRRVPGTASKISIS